jgi:hypothetical protein
MFLFFCLILVFVLPRLSFPALGFCIPYKLKMNFFTRRGNADLRHLVFCGVCADFATDCDLTAVDLTSLSSMSQNELNRTSPLAEAHTFVVEWGPHEIAFFINDQQVLRRATPSWYIYRNRIYLFLSITRSISFDT